MLAQHRKIGCPRSALEAGSTGWMLCQRTTVQHAGDFEAGMLMKLPQPAGIGLLDLGYNTILVLLRVGH
jgi:hypothetical protein